MPSRVALEMFVPVPQSSEWLLMTAGGGGSRGFPRAFPPTGRRLRGQGGAFTGTGSFHGLVRLAEDRDDVAGPGLQAAGLPGINEVASACHPAWAPETWVEHPLDLDIGEIADGYHLIARSISLSAKNLLFEFAFAPERAPGSGVWLNMSYDADIPGSQDCIGAGDEVQYTRPPLKARYAYFDFFRPDYKWYGQWDGSGQPDSDYLRNRVARLTFDLRSGEAQIEK